MNTAFSVEWMPLLIYSPVCGHSEGLGYIFPLSLATNIAKYMTTDGTKQLNVAEFTNSKFAELFIISAITIEF